MTDPKHSTESFYGDLPAFHKFSDLTEPRHYRSVPDDWWIIITDIVGSTAAIEKNRYKDVNLLGASSIVAVLNKLKGRQIPFVFGGDGATILVHASDVDLVRPSLHGSRRLARDVFQFELRIGLVPISDLVARGATIECAKFQISEQSSIATIRGGGLQLAEMLVKDPSTENDRYRLSEPLDSVQSESNFEGLSCRWNPVKAQNGEIMTLLVYSHAANTIDVYRSTIAFIEAILSDDESRPVSPLKLDHGINFRGIFREIGIQGTGKTLGARLKIIAGIFFQILAMRFFMISGATVNGFSSEKYIRELSANSDFQKFDDMVRMVRDCRRDQREKIVAYLERMRLKGDLSYGIHTSNEALLTCLVFQLDNHIHFVDGGDGGYALAARQLKNQMKERAFYSAHSS